MDCTSTSLHRTYQSNYFGQGCGSVVEHLPNACEALNSIPGTAKQNTAQHRFRFTFIWKASKVHKT